MTTTTAIDRPRPPALAAVGMLPVGTDLGWVRHLVPNGPDITRASPARVWDALLGGAANFAVDRRIADQLLAAEPSISWWVGDHQRFLRRAVHHLLDRGIRQFLDLGSGLSTIGGTHTSSPRPANRTGWSASTLTRSPCTTCATTSPTPPAPLR